MFGRSFAGITGLAALVAAALIMPAMAPLPVQAQEVVERERGGLLRFLFNRQMVAPPENVERARPAQRAQQPRAQQRRSQTRRASQGGQQAQQRQSPRRTQQAAAQAPAPPPAAEKSETAKRILVLGDFVAAGTAEGLETAYADRADVIVDSHTNGSSGLVRNDYYDWPATIGGIIADEKPHIVVVQLGGNDRQEMSVNGVREAPRSEAWTREYEQRARQVSQAVAEAGASLVWVGTIPYRFRNMSADMLAFNDIYRKVTEEVGGEFVDVWDGFVDENGEFTASGPDMNGQPAQLRASDGINITRAGKRKLAFYVEKPLNRLIGNATPAVAAVQGPQIPPGFLGPDGQARAVERTQPVALSDVAAPVAGNELVGARVQTRANEPAALAGATNEPRPGRADNFSTMRPTAVQAPRPQPETIVTP